MVQKIPSLEEINRLLDYNPETGVFTWKVQRSHLKKGAVAGCLNRGYWFICVYRTFFYAHRLAWYITYGYLPEQPLDHINRIRTDNRISNLRLADRKINSENKTCKGTFQTNNKRRWRARIKVGSKILNLGTFATEQEAHEVYIKAKKQYHLGFSG